MKKTSKSAKTLGVKRIGVHTICGVRVPIYRATVDQFPELSGCDGYWDPVRSIIWVRQGQSETQERDALVHELAHAFLTLSGLSTTLKVFLGPERSQYWDGDDGVEEALVRQATPHLVALLGSRWR
jgi:hypothetical protein